MAEIQKVKVLSTVDMVQTDRRTWFVVEWKNGQFTECFASISEAKRADVIARINVPESDIVQYCITALEGTERNDVVSYVMGGHSRLEW